MLVPHVHAASANSASSGPERPAARPRPDDRDWVFIDNGVLRLGVIRSSGGGIGWISQSGSSRNLINHWDRGRLIQQSYYGKPDGSFWNQQPWRWNPVQGGDWRGHPARLLELKSGTNTIYARTLPKHWASGQDLRDTTMQEWITLTGKVVHVKFRFTYSGTETHPKTSHEIPAFFVEPDLSTLVLYEGKQPWNDGALSRSQPGWPNESRNIPEHWAAYVDAHGFGIGAYVPIANTLTCYRFGNGNPKAGACSYFAPLTQFAISPGLKFEYDLYVTVGTAEQTRAIFNSLHQQHPKTKSLNLNE